MIYSKVSIGKNPPNDVNVIIEIPAGSSIKYEFDKEAETIVVDRFTHAFMHYPLDYGFIPHTLAEDGDPVDALILSQSPVVPGSMIRSRPIGVFYMEDELGKDEKIIMVPHDKVDPTYKDYQSLDNLPSFLLSKIRHFFERYKDLEEGKWVKVERFGPKEEAEKLITEGIERAKKHKK